MALLGSEPRQSTPASSVVEDRNQQSMVSENLCPPECEDSAGMGFYLISVLKTFIFLKLRGLLFKACLSKLPSVPCRKSFFKCMVSTKNTTYCLIIHSANSGEEKELKVAGCSQTQEIGGQKMETWSRREVGSHMAPEYG